ncbi:MAG: DNA-binding response regulator [Hyphomicrobiales bacterium]|nr:MAG: DNA-binding response regulator [Hyphomicrobiales bacterium]
MTVKRIYIVDDDAAVRDALCVVFDLEGFETHAFTDGEEFVNYARRFEPSCVLLDVHMPGRSGLDILKALTIENYKAPVFIISGQGDIPLAVSAIKQGAYDFIEKPFNAATVISRVNEALRIFENRNKASPADGNVSIFPGLDKLTKREQEVLRLITSGSSNKEAGRELDISPRTVEVHRARIMEKLKARNTADLMRIVLTGENNIS